MLAQTEQNQNKCILLYNYRDENLTSSRGRFWAMGAPPHKLSVQGPISYYTMPTKCILNWNIFTLTRPNLKNNQKHVLRVTYQSSVFHVCTNVVVCVCVQSPCLNYINILGDALLSVACLVSCHCYKHIGFMWYDFLFSTI